VLFDLTSGSWESNMRRRKYLHAHPDFDPVEKDLNVVRDNLYAYAFALGIGCATCHSTGPASSTGA
jgi:hypothetical protein